MSEAYIAAVKREAAEMTDAQIDTTLCAAIDSDRGIAERLLADAGLGNLSAEQFDAAHAEMDESDIGDRWEGQQ